MNTNRQQPAVANKPNGDSRRSRRASGTNPAQILATIAHTVIRERWETIRAQKGLERAPPDALFLALGYLNVQASKTTQFEHNSVVDSVQASRETAEDPMSDAAAFTVLTVAGIVVFAVVAFVVTYPIVAFSILCLALIVVALFRILSTLVATLGPLCARTIKLIPSRYVYPGFAVLSLASLCIFMIGGSTVDPFLLAVLLVQVVALHTGVFMALGLHDFVLAPAGTSMKWLGIPNAKYVESERSAILEVCAMTQQGSGSEATGAPMDPDLEASVDTPLPAPPGITEVVLDDSHEETFDAMRGHLTSVRNYHKVVLWAMVVAFLAFFGVSIYKFISTSSSAGDYVKAFGSAGIGAALFWFGTRVLWANRVSQLSLALFESYVQEVQTSLREIPTDTSPQVRRITRMEVWSVFRRGLNGLWLSERKCLDSGPNAPTP